MISSTPPKLTLGGRLKGLLYWQLFRLARRVWIGAGEGQVYVSLTEELERKYEQQQQQPVAAAVEVQRDN